MRMNVKISLLAVSLLLSATAHAGDSPLCKQICVADKKQCRDDASADEKTDKSASSLTQSDFVNPRKVPTSFVADKLADGDNQAARNDEAGNRRFEKQQVCEKDYRHCSDACSAEK